MVSRKPWTNFCSQHLLGQFEELKWFSSGIGIAGERGRRSKCVAIKPEELCGFRISDVYGK